jgi:transcriptional regulator GlxA family with amidase domain
MSRARAALRNLGADVSVASLASASRLSRSQFILRYRTAFGETPHQTRIRARLERAQWLLATSELSVTDVCMAVGFSSLGSFSRMFRARCGDPPVRYRARLAQTAGMPSPAARLTPHCLSLLAAAWSEPSYF